MTLLGSGIWSTGQGAPRTCRCIETAAEDRNEKNDRVREHHAPVGALRLINLGPLSQNLGVREHHAPVGALRHLAAAVYFDQARVREHHAPVGALRLLAEADDLVLDGSQGAPRTCRCIETGG